MSLKPREVTAVPKETMRVAQAAFPKGNLYLTLRDKLGSIFQDEDFVDRNLHEPAAAAVGRPLQGSFNFRSMSGFHLGIVVWPEVKIASVPQLIWSENSA